MIIPYKLLVVSPTLVKSYLANAKLLPAKTEYDLPETRPYGEILIPKSGIKSDGHLKFCEQLVMCNTISNMADPIRCFVSEANDEDLGVSFIRNFINKEPDPGAKINLVDVGKVLRDPSHKNLEDVYAALMNLSNVPDWLDWSDEQKEAYDPEKGWN